MRVSKSIQGRQMKELEGIHQPLCRNFGVKINWGGRVKEKIVYFKPRSKGTQKESSKVVLFRRGSSMSRAELDLAYH